MTKRRDKMKNKMISNTDQKYTDLWDKTAFTDEDYARNVKSLQQIYDEG